MIEQSIVSRLTNEQTSAFVARRIKNTDGTYRIYPGLIEEGAASPHIAYATNDGDAISSMAGVLGLTKAVMFLNCWAETTNIAKQLRNEVRLNVSGLSGQSIGPHYIRLIQLKDSGDVQFTMPGNAKLNRKGVQLELTIWYLEQAPAPG